MNMNNSQYVDPLEAEYQKQITAEYSRSSQQDIEQQYYPVYLVLVDSVLKQLRTMKGDVGELYLKIAQQSAIDSMLKLYGFRVPIHWVQSQKQEVVNPQSFSFESDKAKADEYRPIFDALVSCIMENLSRTSGKTTYANREIAMNIAIRFMGKVYGVQLANSWDPNYL